jgi:hypothetical protein
MFASFTKWRDFFENKKTLSFFAKGLAICSKL